MRSLHPPCTAAQLDTWQARSRYTVASKYTTVRNLVLNAKTATAACQTSTAISQLMQVRQSGALLSPDALDLDIIVEKLQKRLGLMSTQYASEVTCAGLAQ